jgi:hypothetical protein
MTVKNPWFEKRDFNFPDKCIIYNDGEYYIAKLQPAEHLYCKRKTIRRKRDEQSGII